MKRRSATLATASVALAVLALVAALSMEPSLGSRLPAGAAAAKLAESLWVMTAPGAGAYRSGPLVPVFDISETSWRLQVLARYGLPIPAVVDQSAVAASATSVLDDPASVVNLPLLEVVRLAVSVLSAEGRPIPSDPVSRQLAKLDHGGAFAFDVGDPPSDAALPAVVEICANARLPWPNGMQTHLRERIAATPTDGSLQEAADVTLPVWQASDSVLGPADRAPFRDKLRQRLDRVWTDLAKVTDWDGPTIGLFVAAADVARANDLPAPAFSFERLSSLELPSGYLRLFHAGDGPDAHTTYLAAVAGRALPEELESSLARSAGSAGWGFESGPDPIATAQAEFVLRRLAMDTHAEEVAAQTALWFADLQRSIVDEATLRQNLHALFIVNRIAREVGAKPWAPELGRLDLHVEEWDADEVLWLTAVMLLSPASPDSAIRDALAKRAESPPASRADALEFALLGELTRNSGLHSKAVAFMDTLAVGPLYRSSTNAPGPDLLSTAIGYAIKGEKSIDAASAFAQSSGFAPRPSPLPASDDSTLETLYLAVGIAGGLDPVGVAE